MHNLIFDFTKSPEDLLFDLIELKNDFKITDTNVDISIPQALGRTFTSVLLTPKLSSNLTGVVEVFYDRLDLNRLFFGYNLSFSNIEVLDEETISNVIFERFKLRILPENIKFTVEDFGETLPKRISIGVKDESILWVGEIEAWWLPDNYLGEVFLTHDLSRNATVYKKNAYLYSIEKEFSSLDIALQDLFTEGYIFSTLNEQHVSFLDYLNNNLDDPWTLAVDSEYFNLAGAKVIYNGYLTNDPIDRVIVISLGSKCIKLEGNLVIRYQEVVVEPEATPEP
ncbi:MAG: hypothetical protein IBX57_00900 [Gammaproteobacteria bacterium]|nr:hypothetical protein [Gammaproteobacteria bacterium]